MNTKKSALEERGSPMSLKKVAAGWSLFFMRTFPATLLVFATCPAFAQTTINTATLDGNVYNSTNPYYVALGQTVTVDLNVTSFGGGNWNSSGADLSGAGSYIVPTSCANYINPPNGIYDHIFTVTAPALAGTYTANFGTFTNSSCKGNGGVLDWVNAIVVVGSPPVAITNAASTVTAAGATLNGTVTSNGGPSTVIFEYGLSTGYGSSVTATQSPLAAAASNAAVSYGLTGLTCNTTYHYRVSATNVAGSSLGSDITFTTMACAPAVSSFNAFESATPAGAITGVIKTKIAGSLFSLDVVANSGGAQASGFVGAVKVELLGNTNTGIALNAQNCPTSFTLLQTVTPNPTISGGRSTVNFAAVADAWKDVRVRISYPAILPTIVSCSTDNFAIRPNSLSVSITDTNWQTAGTSRVLNNSSATGGVVHKAGQSFTIRATAYNAAGTSAITGNYAGSPTFLPITCTLPGPGCSNGTLTPGAWTAAGGTVTSTTANYSEAGSFNLTLQDTTFASVDAGDGTPATCAGYYVCSAAISVGRFVPDHFVVTASNAPQLKTFNNAACALRSFTYVGQPFGYVTAPQVLVTAQNAANATTANYTGNLWKLATVAGVKDCTTNPDICTLTSGSVTQTYTYTATPAATPNWDNAQVVLSAPTIVAGSNGTGTVTSASSDLLDFKRSLLAPQALFSASITLADTVTDSSEAGNCGASNCNITTLTPATFNPIAFDSGNEFRYGRLKLANALGSEVLNLPVPIQTQYWNGIAFVTNTADNCTALSVNNVNLSAPPAGVSATVGAFTSGVGSLTLSPPTAAAKVAVNLCVDLGADPVGGTVCAATTSANLSYLQGLWAPGSSYNNDPGALATFGVYKGANEFIYLRENY